MKYKVRLKRIINVGGDISQLLSVVGHILLCNGAASPKLLIIRRHADTEALLDRTFLYCIYDRKNHSQTLFSLTVRSY